MILFVRDNRAVCPSCSGLISAKQNYYFCIDCGHAYIGTGEGRTEGEVIVEDIGGDHGKREVIFGIQSKGNLSKKV